jgi:pectate lyase
MEVDLSPDKRGYVMFDVQGLSGTVSRATLRLLVANASSNGPSVLATGTSWTETGLTWSNQPTLTGSALGQAVASNVGIWAEIDVTSSVIGNGRVAWVLTPNSTDGADISSREGGGAAQLVVTFGGSGSASGTPDAGTSTIADAGTSTLSDAGSGSALDAGTGPRVLRAFPGAEGFGTETPGGRSGRVIAVTNLNDSGPGSFRDAVMARGPRIVVFRVAGTIELRTRIEITEPFLTIAGHTAPGDGITITRHQTADKGPFGIRTHDVVMRYLRIRNIPTPYGSGQVDATTVWPTTDGGTDVYNIVIDHCSFSWGTDEVFQSESASNMTIQWSIIAEGLSHSTHPEGEHSKGMHFRGDHSDNVSIHHNLLAHNMDRSPNIVTTGTFDMVNNVIYDAGRFWTMIKDVFGSPHVNAINNYYKVGPSSWPEYRRDGWEFVFYPSSSSLGLDPRLYVHGNIGPHRPTDDLAQELVVETESRFMLVDRRYDAPPVTTYSAVDAFNIVLERAGATLPVRDAHDQRVAADARNGTGRIIDDPSDVGGLLTMAPGTPPPDADLDGMPDAWERENGLNPNDPSDASRDANGNGYTNVEEYLNWLAR